jgi:glycosyltransferase involved in cell wall biosynthesis
MSPARDVPSRPLKVLLCHNYYQQPGGEDRAFADEGQLLETHGHPVVRFTLHNDVIAQLSRLDVARRTVWNRAVYEQLRRVIRAERPAWMHCTNTFPLISPAAYYAARAEGVPVVQSLHNYRLLCPNGLFHRDGRVCEDCLGKRLPWPGVLHACYRQSRAASAVVATMLGVHRAARTWRRMVQCYVALTEFSRQQFIRGGLPAARIAVKPNFVFPDPGPGPGGGGAVFVGRLSPEKGVDTLLRAWSEPGARMPLEIVGDGPLAEQVRAAAARSEGIRWLGRRPVDEVLTLIGRAACLVLPSTCYENFPKTVVEAFAKGTPVIASRLGAMAELIDDGRTGLLFQPGNPADLAAKVDQLAAAPARQGPLRQAARQEFAEKYTAEVNYRRLMTIYEYARLG